MRILRYLSFEISRDCDLAAVHADKCPIVHPDRYKFSKSAIELTDNLIIHFWEWCRYEKNFRGLVLWNSYNEPTLSVGRIRELMKRIKRMDPGQPFQITTNSDMPLEDFDIVHRSHYGTADYRGSSASLDNRIHTNTGEGKPYSQMKPAGHCARGLGWEVLIDHFGNWCLCCSDWRNEESFGSILNEEYGSGDGLWWETLYQRWKAKARTIRWTNEAEYKALPRMCRACLDVNPSLSQKAGI